ncbi:MAG TPA: cytochrome c oxidase assembly factor Coa1 family protein [Pyrinomonadaceae bacterium]|nr:cytochrome c oxidase assembly factor Coa1 family protein [Pyrinomonadaceae bacterium]
MTTKKVLLIVAATLSGLVLVIALFVGGIVGVVFYTIGHSEAAETAKTFLRKNERLKRDIGEVRDFGFLVTGNIKTQNSAGNAELGLKVVGEKKTVNTTVVMVYRAGREWRVIDAFYDNEAGERVVLTDSFTQGEAAGGDAGAQANAPGPVAGFDEDGFRANVLDPPHPVLVVVGSPSSLDSVELDKTLERLAPKYEQSVSLVRYNLSEQPAVLQRLSVRAVPTVILYRDGEERERRAGKLSRDQLTALLDRYVEE